MSATDVAMLSTCCLMLCLVAVSRQFSITEFTVPEAVEAGQDAELQCRYEAKVNESEKVMFVKWWWTPLSKTRDRTQLYQRTDGSVGEPMKHDIEIKENDTIVLLKLSPADSGTYECDVSNINEVRTYQELIVFTQGSGPQLNISTVQDGPDEDEDEDLLIECEADNVFPLPNLALTINGADINITEIVSGPDGEGLYSVFANATVSKEGTEGAEIRCILDYSPYNFTHQPYIDLELYNPAGAAPPSTEPAAAVTEPPASPDSLQYPKDNGSMLQYSWTLLVTVAVFTQLPALLRNVSTI